ncbi:MAG: TolC family protein, partial [Cyanobacteria bacterium]|nr:TolC family protein [Cyanobacteriota bacterium]
AGGILPRQANYAVGFTLQFPIMQYFKVKAEKGAQVSTIDMRAASYDLALQELIKEDGKARVMLQRSEEIADETPRLVTAARETELKAKERYRVGLTNVVEVADSERTLARAEVQNIEAQLNVWLALLSTAYAHGDLKPFLKLVSSVEAGK